MAGQDEVLRMVAQVVDNATGPLARIGAALRAIGNAPGISHLNAAFQRLHPTIVRVGSLIRSAIGGALTAIGAMAAPAGAAIAAALGFGAKGVLDTAASFEKFEATLETIEGSSAKAKKAMAWVSEFAKTTPYEVSEVTASLVKLKSYGLDPMDGTLSVIGDTASAMGKSLNDAVEMWADASTGEFERMKEFGIRGSKEGKKATFTWVQNGKELSKTMDMNSKNIQKFLRDTFGSKFRGAMVRQAKTWNGMTSNLSDSWADFQRRVANAGFFDAMKARLGDAMDAMSRWGEDGTLDQLATMISNALTGAADAVGTVIERIVTHMRFLSQNMEAAKPYITAVGIALGALTAAAFPLVTAFAVAAVVLDDFFTFLEGGESLTGKALQWIGQLAGQVSKAIPQGFKDAVSGAIEAFTSGDWRGLGTNVARFIVEGIKQIGALMGEVWTLISSGAESGGGWTALGNRIMTAITEGIKAYAQFLLGFWGELGGELVQVMADVGTRIGEAIYNGIAAIGGKVKAFFASLMPTMPSWLSGGATGPSPSSVVGPHDPGKGTRGGPAIKFGPGGALPLRGTPSAAPEKQSALPSSLLARTADAGGVANPQATKGEAKVTVDFKNMPQGVSTSGETRGGLFKQISLNRGTGMSPA